MGKNAQTKPGYKTTEFWLSALATLLGLLMASGIIQQVGQDSWIARIVGGLIAALTSLGYSISRGIVKKSQ